MKHNITNQLKQLFGFVVTSCGFAIMMVSCVDGYMTIPEVKKSYSRNECVAVVNYKKGDDYDCDRLPDTYELVWVE